MGNEVKNDGYGPGRDIANTLLSNASYASKNADRMKALVSEKGTSDSKDTYQYSRKIVNGKIGRIPVSKMPDNYSYNHISDVNVNVEMYNSMSAHNSYKLSQQINKK